RSHLSTRDARLQRPQPARAHHRLSRRSDGLCAGVSTDDHEWHRTTDDEVAQARSLHRRAARQRELDRDLADGVEGLARDGRRSRESAALRQSRVPRDTCAGRASRADPELSATIIFHRTGDDIDDAARADRDRGGAAMKRVIALLLLFVASNAHAVYSSRRAVLPIAGRVSASGVREYTTTLWITNATAKPVRARVTFLASGQANPGAQPVSVDVAARQTMQSDNVTDTLLHPPAKLGALLVEADAPLACTARLSTSSGGAGFAAIPIDLAIPRGGSTELQGAGAGAHGEYRYNIHLVETNRSAIQVVVSLHDANGREVGSQTVLLREHEALTMPIAKLSAAPPPAATVR